MDKLEDKIDPQLETTCTRYLLEENALVVFDYNY